MLAGLSAVAATAATLGAGPAAAAPSVDDIASGLVGPLGLDISEDGRFVAQNFAGSIDRIRPNGTLDNVASVVDASGFVVDGKRITFTTTEYDEDQVVSRARLRMQKADGSVVTLANLLAFEQRRNPDGDVRYGIRGAGKSCREKLPQGVAPYSGIEDAHPYAVAEAPGGGWYVADAAGNDILKVSRAGKIRVVAVLKPVVSRITRKMARSLGLPMCAAGKDVAFEPVPTDVEVAKDGSLVVSLLPGGPEDPAAGARGQVVRIAPGSGKQMVVADGFASATNVAIGKKGKIYVAELFANQISQINRNGDVRRFVQLNQPSAVEYFRGKLYATYDTFPPQDGPPNGKVAVITKSGGTVTGE